MKVIGATTLFLAALCFQGFLVCLIDHGPMRVAEVILFPIVFPLWLILARKTCGLQTDRT